MAFLRPGLHELGDHNNGNPRLVENLFDDIQNLLFGEAVFDGMVHLDPHYLSDVLQYMFLNLTERWLHWFPVRFAAITANCAASLVAFSTFRIPTYFYCQLFFPLKLEAGLVLG